MARRLAIALFLLAVPAGAEVLHGEVVGIQDGDTVTVLDDEKRTHRIRLQGIDAPERRQAHSARSTENLSRLVFRKRVEVQWEKRDRYGRIVGKLLVAPEGCEDCGRTRDANLAQLESGLAWWYSHYAKEQSPEDRKTYEAAEREAREAKRGLWVDPSPTPPWEFRRTKKKAPNETKAPKKSRARKKRTEEASTAP